MPISEGLADRLSGAGPMMKLFVATLKGEANDLTLDQLRAHHREALSAMPVAPNVSFEATDMGGVAGLRATPADVVAGRTLLYLHGGAYIVGDPEGYRGFVSSIAAATSAVVFIPHYRLAPEHPFPAPMNDVLEVYRWLLAQGAEPSEMAFMGDSAGGALTVSVMTMAREAGLPLPAAGVALSPWANLEHTGSSIESRKARDLIHAGVPDALNVMGRTFLAGASARSPEASPVFADLSGLPPILIQVGEAEQLLSDGVQLADRLAEHGVRVTLEVWPGMFHGWQMYHGELEEGADALENACSFVRQAVSGRRLSPVSANPAIVR